MISKHANTYKESSPRWRGCFLVTTDGQQFDLIFPALAGVFPLQSRTCRLGRSFPRASVGVSPSSKETAKVERSSPRQRGCFLSNQRPPTPASVFPTPVGVVLGEW